MFKKRSVRITAIVLAVVLLLSMVASAALNYDLNGDGKTNIWDLQLALNDGASKEDQDAALKEALGAGDELHKNAEGQWEIWTSLGLYNMAKNAQAGDTFVLMQDIDMGGALWTPVESFNGKFIGSEKYTVSNMKITQSVGSNMGFFGSIAEGGNIYRLNLKNVNLIVDADTTSIGLLAGTCAGTVDACTTIGFVTDERTALPADLHVGGLVGTLQPTGVVVVNVENMLQADENSTDVPNISAKLATRFVDLTTDTYERIIGIVGDVGSGSVDAMAILQDVTGVLPDPNAIAWVNNTDGNVFPLNLTDLLAAISSDGNSVITLQSDITNNGVITLPYSCTLDFNGYTVTTSLTSGNGIMVNATGTENKTLTLKNGTMRFHTIGVRVNKGAVVLSNMTMLAVSGAPVGIYDTTDYSSINKIENSTLLSGAYGCIAFNTANADMSATGITITSSKVISAKAGGHVLLVKNSGTTPGTVTVGTNVDFYTYGTKLTNDGNIAGVDPVKMEKTADVTVDGVTYTGLNHWTTDEAVIATAVIAEVTDGTETIEVTNIKDLSDAISSTGNTKIKLVKDIECTSVFTLPYSCTLDLNNFSVTNSTSNAVYISGVGSENKVTYIKNGTLNHGVIGVRVDTGSIDLSNVTINGVGSCGASVAFYDSTSAYRANNKIDGCYFYNPNYRCISWNKADTDFSTTGVLISNTTLIAAKNYVFGQVTDRMSGVNELGENVSMYSNKTVLGNGTFPRYSGLQANLTDETSVTVNGTAITGLKNWSTAKTKDTVNILLLGNSLSTTLPEEIYQIAEADGHEVVVTDLYHGGACGWQHKEWIQNAAPEYEYRVYNDMGFWMHGDIKTVSDAIPYMDWDHVSYQEWFQKNKNDGITPLTDFTFENACALFESYNDWVYDYLKTNIPNAELYCYQHWSWQVGHGHVPDVATQTQMYEMIQQTTEYFAEKYAVTLIPCGDAVQLARVDSSIGDVLCYPDDKVHSYEPTGGQYLIGSVFYEVMFQESCIGNTWRKNSTSYPSEATQLLLQQYAHQAVAAVYGDDYAK